MSGRIHTVASAPVLDLSEGGALLEVPCALRPRSLYNFRLSLGEGRLLTLQSSVVRSYVHSFETVGTKGESRVQYRAAIQFVNLSEADRALLRVQLYGSVEGEHSPEELLADLLGSEPRDGVAPPPLESLSSLLDDSESSPEGAAPPAPATASLPPLPDVEPLPSPPDVATRPTPPHTAPLEAPVAAPAEGSAPALEPLPQARDEQPATERPQAEQPAPAPEPLPQARDEQPATERPLAEPPAPAPEPPPPTRDEQPATERQQAEQPDGAPEPLPQARDEQPAIQTPPSVPVAPPAKVVVEPRLETTSTEVVSRQPTPHPSAWQRIKGWISSRPAAERARGSSILGLDPAPTPEKPPADERRESTRVFVEGSVSGEMGLAVQSEIEALSVGGLMARMPFAPQNGSELSFTIEVNGRPIVVAGSVRNVQEVHGDAGDVEYKVGLEFGALDDEVRAVLKDYVDRRLATSKTNGAPLD